MDSPHDAKVAADARRPYALAIEANLAKLKQLQKDADDKLWGAGSGPDLATSERDHVYWSGWQDGITRAIKVLEGRG